MNILSSLYPPLGWLRANSGSVGLADPSPSHTWRVQRYSEQIAEGDSVFVWSSRPGPGLYAVLQIDAAPEEMVEPQSDRRHRTELLPTGPELMVGETITDRFPAIPESEVAPSPGLPARVPGDLHPAWLRIG